MNQTLTSYLSNYSCCPIPTGMRDRWRYRAGDDDDGVARAVGALLDRNGGSASRTPHWGQGVGYPHGGLPRVLADGSRVPKVGRPSHRLARGSISDSWLPAAMSANKKLIESLEGKKPVELAPLLADDVEWIEWADGVPASGARLQGRAAFIQNYGDDEVQGHISRMTEENNVVVTEQTVHVRKKDGTQLTVQACNIYELEDGNIKRKSPYGALVKDAA